MINLHMLELEECTLLYSDRSMCKKIFLCVLLQCILVFTGAATILECIWTPAPDNAYDIEKLARITYLYDHEACGHQLSARQAVRTMNLTSNIDLPNIRRLPELQVTATVSERISKVTRSYVEVSVGMHCAWLLVAIALWIFSRPKTIDFHILNYVIWAFFLTTITVIIFDLSMGLVYITHIKQSLSNEMVLRYSGWSVEMTLDNPTDFAGWLPMIASACWMRGVIVLGYNIYSCKNILKLQSRTRRKEIKKHLEQDENLPVPYPKSWRYDRSQVIYFRTGEYDPHIARKESFFRLR